MSYSTSIEITKEDITTLSNSFYRNVITNKDSIENIISLSKNAELPKELRPTAWKIFLNIFPNNSNIIEWVEIINKLRLKYNKKKKKYLSIKKYKGDPLDIGGNALNKKNDKNFNTLYEENELRRIINLDIIRTYQNINLFSQENIKKLLLNILFVWCKENDDISYRQGMNDLLAILILCLYPYYFSFEEKEKEKISKEEIINYINIKDAKERFKYSIKIYKYFHDESEIECDLFFAFDSLMKKGMKNLFNPKLIQKGDREYKLYEIFSNMYKDEIDEEKSNFISRRCFLLINEKLKIIDEELFQYFKKIDINCGAFLQKWFRCIFCREFDLNQIFILWDVILTNDYTNENQKYSLAFMDSICLAMIIRLRKYILKLDQNDCFSLLFKYPKIDNIKNIINLAYNIHQIIIQKKNGKDVDTKMILNIANSFKDNDEEIIDRIKSNNDISKIKVYSTNDTDKKFLFGNYNNNINPDKIDENKNNNTNINEYQEQSLFDGALSSLGKIGNKLKDQLKVAKDAVLGLELNINYNNDKNDDDNNININKESKMSELFDIPNNNKENENKKQFKINHSNNNLINIIKRLERLDNKYNKYFDTEDKNELKNIISELSK